MSKNICIPSSNVPPRYFKFPHHRILKEMSVAASRTARSELVCGAGAASLSRPPGSSQDRPPVPIAGAPLNRRSPLNRNVNSAVMGRRRRSCGRSTTLSARHASLPASVCDRDGRPVMTAFNPGQLSCLMFHPRMFSRLRFGPGQVSRPMPRCDW